MNILSSRPFFLAGLLIQPFASAFYVGLDVMTRIPLLKSTFPTKLILDLTGFMPSKLEMYFTYQYLILCIVTYSKDSNLKIILHQ